MILSVNNVYKSYGKEQVLKGITFYIEHPQIIALVGPNGSGKSTLLNIVTNLISSDKGKVTILGKSNHDPSIFRDVSFMQDNSVLYDYLTGFDHLQFIGNVQGLKKQELLQTAEQIGITGYLNKKVKNYSLGMKQHLLLAMAVVNHPKLLILDEPLNGLDPTSAIRVRNLLLSLHENGTTILLSSHNLAEIDRVTSTIMFLKKGSLIEEDISQFEQISYHYILQDIAMGETALKANGIAYHKIGYQVQVRCQDASLQDVLQVFDRAGITIEDIEKKVIGSEDRYRNIFTEQVGARQ